MKQLLFATGNLNKAKELAELTKPLDIEILTLKDFPQLESPEETGSTFLENALIKARSGANDSGLWALADDSGLTVDALDGAPGIYSARYAGENAGTNENNQKLLLALDSVEDGKRQAQFRATLALVSPQGTEYSTEGVVQGEILREYRGSNGFGYDPLFYIPDLGKTMAQLTMEEKNKISHRAKAFKKIITILEKVLT